MIVKNIVVNERVGQVGNGMQLAQQSCKSGHLDQGSFQFDFRSLSCFITQIRTSLLIQWVGADLNMSSDSNKYLFATDSFETKMTFHQHPNLSQHQAYFFGIHIIFSVVFTSSMDSFLEITILLFTLFLTNLTTPKPPPLKALLYCYLPTFHEDNPMPELNRLKDMINEKLAIKGINVEVDISNPKDNHFYDGKVNEYFNTYDILEIDMLTISQISTPLMSFTAEDIKGYFDDIFPFQWEPLKREEDGVVHYIGSPARTCGDFLSGKASSDDAKDVLFVKGGMTQYILASYYAGLYLNKHPSASLATIHYQTVQDNLIKEIAQFLLKTQPDKSRFRYSTIESIKAQNGYPANLADTASQQALGYSQYLYRFFADGLVKMSEADSITVQHILGCAERKLVYVDQYIAKKTDDDQSNGRKQTILRFNQEMVSDEIQQIYVQGLYLDNRRQGQYTYIIPPTISYFNQLRQKNSIYDKIYKCFFQDTKLDPIYHKEYAENMKQLSERIKVSLKAYSQQLDAQQASRNDQMSQIGRKNTWQTQTMLLVQ